MRIFSIVYITIFINICFSFSQEKQIHYANNEDIKKISNASLGDIIISGPTKQDKGNKYIWIDDNYNNKILPGCKILIAAGDYDEIAIECNNAGTKNKPIIITNYNGQVKTKVLKISGLKYFKLTGRYDAKSKTGDSLFRGHELGYAYSQGRYGIFIDNEWKNTDKFLLEITSKKDKVSGLSQMCSDFEIEYIESGNGGYTNVIKANNEKYISENIIIHDCYFHDTDGEGIYMGNTSTEGEQGIFRNVEIYNNRILRSGLDALQIVQTGSGTKIHHNVLDGGMRWRSSFMENQDFGASLSFISGGVDFYNNIIINGGNAIFQVFLEKENWYKYSREYNEIKIYNNLFLKSRSGLGAYIGPYNGNFQGLKISIFKNDFNSTGFQYNKLDKNKHDSKYMIIGGYAGNGSLYHNRWIKGKSKKDFFSSNFESEYTVTQNENQPIEQVIFENYATNGYGFNFLEFWTDKLNIGKEKGNPVTYEPGEVVCCRSKIYLCTKANSQIEPGMHPYWEKYWRLLKFNNGKSYLPADDVRVKKDNYHFILQRGIN